MASIIQDQVDKQEKTDINYCNLLKIMWKLINCILKKVLVIFTQLSWMNATRRDMIYTISIKYVILHKFVWQELAIYPGNTKRLTWEIKWEKYKNMSGPKLANCNEGRQMNELYESYVIAELSSGYNVSSISVYGILYLFHKGII